MRGVRWKLQDRGKNPDSHLTIFFGNEDFSNVILEYRSIELRRPRSLRLMLETVRKMEPAILCRQRRRSADDT